MSSPKGTDLNARAVRNSHVVFLVAHVDEAYDQSDLTLGSLSRRLGVSLQYLGVQFRSYTGARFRDFVRSVRIRKAAGLLREHDLLIKQVACMSGYSATSNFDRDFRRIHGVSPQVYRVGSKAQAKGTDSGRQ